MTITIPPRPRIDVPLSDPQTGKITKPWHDYLVKLEKALQAATA